MYLCTYGHLSRTEKVPGYKLAIMLVVEDVNKSQPEDDLLREGEKAETS